MAWYCLWVFWIWKESNCSVRKSHFLERILPPPPLLLPLYYCVITLNVFPSIWRIVKRKNSLCQVSEMLF
jgi:hypothetical protein